MSLTSVVEALQKRPLTVEEVSNLNEFQQMFDIDDDDPLIVVLAMMARSQLIVETVPQLLQQKVTETIELHRNVLREQAGLIAKELIAELSHQIQSANTSWKSRWTRYAVCVAGGALFAIVVLVLVKAFVH